jgi:hypothetical protein
VQTTVDAQPDDFSWLSFWVKWPASLQNVGDSVSPFGNVAPFNEPVDETLVRMRTVNDVRFSTPGTAGVAPVVNSALGIIEFDGGNTPEFYDFATFSSGGSFVSPPHPMFQADDQWIWRWTGCNMGSELWEKSNPGYELADWTKSMRKLPAGAGLLMVIANLAILSAGDGSIPVTVTGGGDTRMWVKTGFSL